MYKLSHMIMSEFPEVVHEVDVGRTYGNATIRGFVLGLNLTGDNWEEQAKERPAILIDGLHHARDLTSTSMCVYTILRTLFMYTKSD